MAKSQAELLTFESFEAFITLAEHGTKRHETFESREASDTFAGTSWTNALTLAKTGWPEGTAKITKLTQYHLDKLTSLIDVPTIQYDVTGIDFDMGLVVSQVPESWTTFVHETRENTGFQIVRIVYNYSTPGSVSVDQMIAKGATVAALVMLLESAGIRTEVIAVDSIGGSNIERIWETRVRLKYADQPIDIDRLAFGLCHPAMLRRLTFSLIEQSEHNWETYGRPQETKDKGDLYIPFTSGYDWTDTESAQAWILSQLKLQGVHLKGE